jgi:hypothetical protein
VSLYISASLHSILLSPLRVEQHYREVILSTTLPEYRWYTFSPEMCLRYLYNYVMVIVSWCLGCLAEQSRTTKRYPNPLILSPELFLRPEHQIPAPDCSTCRHFTGTGWRHVAHFIRRYSSWNFMTVNIFWYRYRRHIIRWGEISDRLSRSRLSARVRWCVWETCINIRWSTLFTKHHNCSRDVVGTYILQNCWLK